MSYDDAYLMSKDYFGSEPEKMLVDHYKLIDTDFPALDIGAGQGRHSFFLADNGYSVEAIDPSKVAVETLQKIADKEGLSIKSFQAGFDDFHGKEESYSAILIFGIFQIVNRDAIHRLIKKSYQWCKKGGLVFVSAFRTDDPSFGRFEDKKPVGKNSFTYGIGNYFTFLEKDEMLTLFRKFDVVYHKEYLGPMHRHGDNPPHQHSVIEGVFKKK